MEFMNRILFISKTHFAWILFGFSGMAWIAGKISAQTLGTSEIDSLKKRIIAGSESDQSGIMNALSETFLESGEYDSALAYAYKALEEATKHNHIINRAHALKNEAEVFYSLNSYNESISAYERAIPFYEEAGLSEDVSYCHNVTGILYRKQFNYKKALEHTLVSLRIAEEAGLLRRKSIALFNVAMIHHALLQYDQAVQYYTESLKADEIRNDTLGMAKVHCNLGICYTAKKDPEAALNAYQQSHRFYSAVRDTEGIALTLNNMGVLFLKTGRYDEAYDYLRRALFSFEAIGDVEGQAYALNSIADIHFFRGETAKAFENNYQSLGMTRETDLRKSIYESLTRVYEKNGNFRQAFEYHQKWSAAKDSILNRENSQQLAEIQVRYETEKKEQEIAYLKIANDRQRENQLWTALGLVFVTVFTVLLYLSRLRIARNRKQLGRINSCFLSFGFDPHKNILSLTALFRELTGAEYAFYLRSGNNGYELAAGDRTPDHMPQFFPFDKNLFPHGGEISSGDIRLITLRNQIGSTSELAAATRTGITAWACCPVRYNGACNGFFVAAFRRHRAFSREERKIAGILASAAGTEEERRIAEEALQVSERRYHDLFDHSLGFIGVHDLNGRLQMVNPAAARSLGYTPGEMTGRPVTDFMNPSMKGFFPAYLDKISKDASFSGMMRVLTKAGQPRVWIFYNILYDEPGSEPFILGHALDITDLVTTRKEREKLIHELQRALAKVKTLSGLLPICASCKKIRDDKGYWNQIENYISVHSNAEFSHGMCPECQRRLYPELFGEDE